MKPTELYSNMSKPYCLIDATWCCSLRTHHGQNKEDSSGFKINVHVVTCWLSLSLRVRYGMRHMHSSILLVLQCCPEQVVTIFPLSSCSFTNKVWCTVHAVQCTTVSLTTQYISSCLKERQPIDSTDLKIKPSGFLNALLNHKNTILCQIMTFNNRLLVKKSLKILD